VQLQKNTARIVKNSINQPSCTQHFSEKGRECLLALHDTLPAVTPAENASTSLHFAQKAGNHPTSQTQGVGERRKPAAKMWRRITTTVTDPHRIWSY
jgi:hypothetical protein